MKANEQFIGNLKIILVEGNKIKLTSVQTFCDFS